jgi:hypothetical protein
MAQPAPAPQDNTDTDPETNIITIRADGTYSPSSITINNGGVAKFEVTYPTGDTVCKVTLGTITFSSSDRETAGGTVKIGS